MNPKSDEKQDENERNLLALAAAHTGLRRFLLEWHSQQTGQPMNQTMQKLEGYLSTELDRMLQELPADDAHRLDIRKHLKSDL